MTGPRASGVTRASPVSLASPAKMAFPDHRESAALRERTGLKDRRASQVSLGRRGQREKQDQWASLAHPVPLEYLETPVAQESRGRKVLLGLRGLRASQACQVNPVLQVFPVNVDCLAFP